MKGSFVKSYCDFSQRPYPNAITLTNIFPINRIKSQQCLQNTATLKTRKGGNKNSRRQRDKRGSSQATNARAAAEMLKDAQNKSQAATV